MSSDAGLPYSPPGAPDLDELQRGQETPPTVETLEPPPQHGDRRYTAPVPDPGERPRAIRPDTGGETEPEDKT